MTSGGSEGNNESYLRSRFRLALHSSNNILSGLSTNISKLSLFQSGSTSSLNAETSSVKNLDDCDSPLALHKLPGPIDMLGSPASKRKSPTTMTERLKETFKLDNLPTFEDMMQSDSSTEPSTLPTNTPESPKSGFRFALSSINQSLPKKLEDYKALAMRTLSGENSEANTKGNKACALNVELVDGNEAKEEKTVDSLDLDNASTCMSSYASSHSMQPELSDKLKIKQEAISSGSASENGGMGHSISVDSTDSDPHRKLWIRSSSQGSLRSWASSLSFDSQADEQNERREFAKNYVEQIFKEPHSIDVDKKSEFGKVAQTECGRLWFARCINAKRCCKKVSEATFFSLTQHFSVMLFECFEADDFSPAKSLMNMCFTFYYETETPNGRIRKKEYLYAHLKQQPIWRSLRFWNAAFFDALQCERFLRPVVTRDEIECNRQQVVTDELRYQENITFGQLGTFTCNMHAFGLSKEMVTEFLRKQVSIASLRSDQVNLLRENVERMFNGTPAWD